MASRAEAVRYYRKTGRVLVELDNGCSFAFPGRTAGGLEHASDADLASVELLGSGYGLHWESRDVDLSVPGLLAGLFGTKAHMGRLRESHAGRVTSPLKATTARRNGQKAGRPRKSVG